MGCCIMKGVTEQCMVRLHLTSPGWIEQKILLLEHVNSFTTNDSHKGYDWNLVIGKYHQ